MKSDKAIRKMLFGSKLESSDDLMLYKALENQKVLVELLLDIRRVVVGSYNINAGREGMPHTEYTRMDEE